jgi:hypothetical protein
MKMVNSKELFLYTNALADTLATTYFHKEILLWRTFGLSDLRSEQHTQGTRSVTSGQIQHESWPNYAGSSNTTLCVPDSPQQASYIHQTPQQASHAQQEPHQATYPHSLNSPITLSTHSKQQQQVEHQPKQQTSHKHKKALKAMTMTNIHPVKQSVEEGRKERAPEPQKSQQYKGISHKIQTTTLHK